MSFMTAMMTSELRYPHGEAPAYGEAIALAPDVLWLRMPLPGQLNHINVWALGSDAGWTIVDTGMNSEDSRATWEKVFAGPMRGKPVVQVMSTHMHPDHVGLAGWLTRRFDCLFRMSRLEYLTCRALVADTGRAAPEAGVRFFRAAGWNEQELAHYKSRFGQFGMAVYEMPDSYRRLEDGEILQIGAHAWRVVIGRGHSPEHACFYCAELKLLISGDQVLPRISSNVSVYPTEPDSDPLSEWLESLARIKTTIPDDVLVLPAHGLCFYGLHARIDKLIGDHEKGLASLKAGLTRPHRAVDVFEMLFTRPIRGDMLLGMATGESLAHLAWLRKRGIVTRVADADGVDWYQLAQPSAS
jgi:glyoxylase-like metal-dependent hydrolase (beta-lactamase superfamily II)